MKGTIEARAKDLALYMIEHRSTVRSAAKAFGVSKSTVHKDLQERLPAINPVLYPHAVRSFCRIESVINAETRSRSIPLSSNIGIAA